MMNNAKKNYVYNIEMKMFKTLCKKIFPTVLKLSPPEIPHH